MPFCSDICPSLCLIVAFTIEVSLGIFSSMLFVLFTPAAVLAPWTAALSVASSAHHDLFNLKGDAEMIMR